MHEAHYDLWSNECFPCEERLLNFVCNEKMYEKIDESQICSYAYFMHEAQCLFTASCHRFHLFLEA